MIRNKIFIFIVIIITHKIFILNVFCNCIKNNLCKKRSNLKCRTIDCLMVAMYKLPKKNIILFDFQFFIRESCIYYTYYSYAGPAIGVDRIDTYLERHSDEGDILDTKYASKH